MRNTNYNIIGLISVATILLLFTQCTDQKGNTGNTAGLSTDSIGFHLPVAYVNTDSLLNNYKFSVDLNENILKKMEDQRVNINKRWEKFQKDYLSYAEKAQMNAYYSAERKQQEETRLGNQQREIEQYQARMEQELAVENARMQQQLHDTISTAMKEYGKMKNYQMVFSNAGMSTFFYIDDSYDVTQEVIEFLNARYVPVQE